MLTALFFLARYRMYAYRQCPVVYTRAVRKAHHFVNVSSHVADRPCSYAAINDIHVLKDSEQSTSAREDVDGEAYSGRGGDMASSDEGEDVSGGTRPSRGGARRGDQRRPHRQGDLEITDRRGGSSSPNNMAERDWAEGKEGPTSSPRRHGRRPGGLAMGNGHARPTPSYALPTKHFKAVARYYLAVTRGSLLCEEALACWGPRCCSTYIAAALGEL